MKKPTCQLYYRIYINISLSLSLLFSSLRILRYNISMNIHSRNASKESYGIAGIKKKGDNTNLIGRVVLRVEGDIRHHAPSRRSLPIHRSARTARWQDDGFLGGDARSSASHRRGHPSRQARICDARRRSPAPRRSASM